MKSKLKKEWNEFITLTRSIPSIFVTLFIVSVVGMNLLANKSINMPVSWLALDAGILLSWVSFLTMDVITKHFGLKAANQLAVLGVVINLFVCLIFFIASIIPGDWGESYVEGSQDIINNALNNTFGGTWYVLLGSTTAFLVSALVNNAINFTIGKVVKKDNFTTFIFRTYVSTMIGQFVDNLTFALIVSLSFFGWSITQCFTCALTGAIVELLFEVIFSPFGYKITKNWAQDGVGEKYFNILKANKEN